MKMSLIQEVRKPQHSREKFIVLPCLNEESAIHQLRTEYLNFLEHNLEWSLVFFDDGSNDATWLELIKLHSLSERIMIIRGHSPVGKILAQGLALSIARKSCTSSENFQVGFMDADGQHPLDVMKMLVSESDRSDCTVFAKRLKYRRTIDSRVGLSLLWVLAKFLGLGIDLNLSEFVVFSRLDTKKLMGNPNFGFLPLGVLAQSLSDRRKFIDFKVTERIDGGIGTKKSRHETPQLIRKALLSLYSDAWRIVSAIMVRSFLLSTITFLYGVFIGARSLLSGDTDGIASLILIFSAFIIAVLALNFLIVGILIIERERSKFLRIMPENFPLDLY
jgi:glycosyltransferase involved in cell wall biosynthesis